MSNKSGNLINIIISEIFFQVNTTRNVVRTARKTANHPIIENKTQTRSWQVVGRQKLSCLPKYHKFKEEWRSIAALELSYLAIDYRSKQSLYLPELM